MTDNAFTDLTMHSAQGHKSRCKFDVLTLPAAQQSVFLEGASSSQHSKIHFHPACHGCCVPLYYPPQNCNAKFNPSPWDSMQSDDSTQYYFFSAHNIIIVFTEDIFFPLLAYSRIPASSDIPRLENVRRPTVNWVTAFRLSHLEYPIVFALVR